MVGRAHPIFPMENLWVGSAGRPLSSSHQFGLRCFLDTVIAPPAKADILRVLTGGDHEREYRKIEA